MAAALHNGEESFDEEQYNAHMSELESAKTENEVDEKVSSMSRVGFSISSWMKYVFNRDTASVVFNPVWLTIEEYKTSAQQGLEDAWRVINLPTWKAEKRGAVKGDIVESTYTEEFGKAYRFTGVVNCPANFLYEEIRDGMARMPEWNPTILRSELIKEIGDGVDLSYQVTAGGGRGIIAPRDFVTLRKAAQLDRDGRLATGDSEPYCYISSGTSVEVPGYPPHKDMVRGQNKVGCWLLKPVTMKNAAGQLEVKTVFQWLMCCDLRGKIPQFVLDTAFATVMLDYIVHVRRHAADAKSKGKF